MTIECHVLGAGQEVGKSCVVVTINGKRIMFDCGMHMGYLDHRRYPDFSLIPRDSDQDFTNSLTCIIITHFHLDHIGALPYFTEVCGYKGPIYMTYPTRALAPLMLEDYRKVMVDRRGEEEQFSAEHIAECMKKVTAVDLKQTVQVDKELQIRAYYAGHVLGAAMFYAKVGDAAIVYTGDYNMTPDRHLGAAQIDRLQLDLVITESTYATTFRDSKYVREREFLKAVHNCVAGGGKVLIPSFALGRAQQIVPPVLNSFSDQDSRVRYYACEALYNIAKVVRGDFIVFFNQIFDALCKLSADSDANVQSAAHLLDRLVKDIVTESDQFSIEEFIPLLRERMNVLNPYVRQFLVGWITVLDSVPDIDMLGFLPDFLDGLFNMLSDSSHEIRQQADSALSEFLQEIKNSPSVDYGRMAEILVQRAASQDEFTRLTAITWINEFVKLGGDQLVPYYADILGAILPCISDKEEKIRVVARETNEELRAIKADPAEGFDFGEILSVARRHLASEWEATRIEALHWIYTLLNRHRTEVLTFLNDIFDTLLKALSDPSDEVVLLVLEVHACIAKDPQHFRKLVVFLVLDFRVDNSLLERRGALIIRRLCVLLDAERVYREFSTILEGESDLDFASIMVQALNLILLTSSELSDLRDLLKQSLVNAAGKDLFISLYASWCHSPMAIVSLCLLAQAYQHASSVVQSLVEEDINVKFLVQLDKLIHLLETPNFAYLRLQLLEPGRYIWLLKALYGLLMLLPQQSAAFKILRTRLKTVPSYSFSSEQLRRTASWSPYSQMNYIGSGSQVSEDGDTNDDSRNVHNGINFALRLQQFDQIQQQHRMHAKIQTTQSRYSSSSTKEVQRPEESKRSSAAPDISRPPSRSSRRGPGQLQL